VQPEGQVNTGNASKEEDSFFLGKGGSYRCFLRTAELKAFDVGAVRDLVRIEELGLAKSLQFLNFLQALLRIFTQLSPVLPT